MLFWHMAGRWGHVRTDGVVLRLRLTHNVLAEIVGARRPTVTTALSELAAQGLLRPVEDAWLLTGEDRRRGCRNSWPLVWFGGAMRGAFDVVTWSGGSCNFDCIMQ